MGRQMSRAYALSPPESSSTPLLASTARPWVVRGRLAAPGSSRQPLMLRHKAEVIGNQQLVELTATVTLPDDEGMVPCPEEEDRRRSVCSLVPEPRWRRRARRRGRDIPHQVWGWPLESEQYKVLGARTGGP